MFRHFWLQFVCWLARDEIAGWHEIVLALERRHARDKILLAALEERLKR